MFQSPNNSLTMSTAPKNMLGISGSVNALIRNMGMISGISIAVLLLYGRMSHKIGYHVSGYVQGRDDVFIYGMKGVYMTAALICAAGALLTAFRLYNQRKRAVLFENGPEASEIGRVYEGKINGGVNMMSMPERAVTSEDQRDSLEEI